MSTFCKSMICDDDDILIMKSFSKSKVHGLIIHGKLLIDNSLVTPALVSSMCVDCTLLLSGGKDVVRRTLVLFNVNHVG